MEDIRITYLKEQIDHRISSFDNSRVYYRKNAFYGFMAITILSGISTIILGIKVDNINIGSFNISVNDLTRIIALIISSTITVLSAYNSFFDHKKLWINNQTTLNNFYELKFDIDFRLQSPALLTEQEIVDFKDRYQTILKEANSRWEKYRLEGSEQSQKD